MAEAEALLPSHPTFSPEYVKMQKLNADGAITEDQSKKKMKVMMMINQRTNNSF